MQMTKLHILTGVVALLLLVLIFELLRRRQLREKYAVLWLAVGLLTLPFGFIPNAFDHVSNSLGVHNGASLVLFLAVVFLLLVCIHLSWEASRLEDETRALAEEVALIRTELRDITRGQAESAIPTEETSAGPDGRRVEIIAQRQDRPDTEGALIGER
jgi:hypothetical protein